MSVIIGILCAMISISKNGIIEMDSQEQASSGSALQSAKPETNKCNHMVVIAILAILTVGGVTFGGVEL